MKLAAIHHVAIIVSDYEKAREFYVNKLGFAVVRENFRKNRMSNARIQQVVTLLFMHKTVVTSSGVKTSESEELHKVMTRIYKHIDYYKGNPEVKNTFDFLKMVVDSWFPNE